MANPKLFSEFRSSYGHFYLIEIWDEDYTGNNPEEFNITSQGFQLNYSGQTDNIYSPVIGSSVSIGMYIRNAATTAFLESLKNYQENRYFIKIWKGEFNGQNASGWYNTTKVSDDGLVMNFSTAEENVVYLDFFWGGYIVQDIVSIEDVSEPYILQLQATDGISKLQNIDGPDGITPIQNVFSNAIFLSYSYNIYPTEWPALKMISNWWSQQHTYNANENVLETSVVDLSVFHSYDADGTVNKVSFYEVLTGICRIFGLRFYYSNGSYRAEQIFQRDNDTIKEFSYKPNGSLIGYESVTRDKTINQTSNRARLAGNIFNFLPAVNETRIQTSEDGIDYNGVISTNVATPLIDLGFTPSIGGSNFLEITFNYEITLTANVTDNAQFLWYMFDVDVIQDNGTTVYYLERDHTKLQPLGQTWTTTQADGGYQVLAGRLVERSDLGFQNLRGQHTIVTPVLQTDGDITVQFNSNRFINANGTTKVLNSSNASTWRTTVRSITKSIGTNGYDIRSKTTNTNNGSGIIYNLGDTKIFDGPGTAGSLYQRNPSTLAKTLTTGWREGNSGTYNTIQRLVANEFLSLMNKPVQKYQGSFISSHNFMTRLVFDSKNWLQLGGTFTANFDEWDGEWFAISKESITISNTDTGVATDPVFSIGGSNGIGDINIAALDVNTLIGVNAALDNNVTVGNDLDVTGDETVGGTLGVTGISTLSATTVKEFTTTERVNVTINAITANDGGSENLTAIKHFNFITYEGGTGTYTITLPEAEEGVILRFKTDDTIGANKTITLQPQSGGRIDSESTYVMNRSYDGVSLLGRGGANKWYIIQKKEK